MAALQPPTPYQWSVADVATAAILNAQLYNGLTFLLNPPMFSGYQTTTQLITTGTPTAITIDTESFDTANGHSNTTNPSRYTPPVPGTYFVTGTVAWTAVTASASYRRAWIRLNGGNQHGMVGSIDQSTAVACAVTASGLVQCNGTTDYIELWGAQATGANLSTVSNSDYVSSLSVYWVSN